MWLEWGGCSSPMESLWKQWNVLSFLPLLPSRCVRSLFVLFVTAARRWRSDDSVAGCDAKRHARKAYRSRYMQKSWLWFLRIDFFFYSFCTDSWCFNHFHSPYSKKKSFCFLLLLKNASEAAQQCWKSVIQSEKWITASLLINLMFGLPAFFQLYYCKLNAFQFCTVNHTKQAIWNEKLCRKYLIEN